MIKLKSTIVIILSSILISAVVLFTILALSLYIGWKESESIKEHRDTVARLNVALYGKYITIQDLRARCEKKDIYKDKCLLEGLIKNTGFRTVSSISVNIDFLNNSGNTIYTERVFPLKGSLKPSAKTIAALSLFTSGREQPLMPARPLRFIHVLREQKNKNITSPIKNKKYATNPSEWSGKFNKTITHIKF